MRSELPLLRPAGAARVPLAFPEVSPSTQTPLLAGVDLAGSPDNSKGAPGHLGSTRTGRDGERHPLDTVGEMR